MTRFFGGPGNFEQRYRQAEAEAGVIKQAYIDYKASQRRAGRSYLIAYLAIVAIVFVSFCFFWRFA